MQGIFQFSQFLWTSHGQCWLSVCNSHKVKTQTVHFFVFSIFSWAPLYRSVDSLCQRLVRLGIGGFESSCIWCGQNVVNQLTNILVILFSAWLLLNFSQLAFILFRRTGKDNNEKGGSSRNNINIFAIAQKGNWKHNAESIRSYIDCEGRMVTLTMTNLTVPIVIDKAY